MEGSNKPAHWQPIPHAELHGVDVSTASLALARQRHGAVARFGLPAELAQAQFDLVYCNGVFHHIPPRWVMSRIPFDKDAVMVWPRQARSLMHAAGLQVQRTEFHFIWPRRGSVNPGCAACRWEQSIWCGLDWVSDVTIARPILDAERGC